MYLTLQTLPAFLKCAEMRSLSHAPTAAAGEEGGEGGRRDAKARVEGGANPQRTVVHGCLPRRVDFGRHRDRACRRRLCRGLLARLLLLDALGALGDGNEAVAAGLEPCDEVFEEAREAPLRYSGGSARG